MSILNDLDLLGPAKAPSRAPRATQAVATVDRSPIPLQTPEWITVLQLWPEHNNCALVEVDVANATSSITGMTMLRRRDNVWVDQRWLSHPDNEAEVRELYDAKRREIVRHGLEMARISRAIHVKGGIL